MTYAYINTPTYDKTIVYAIPVQGNVHNSTIVSFMMCHRSLMNQFKKSKPMFLF